jgi:3-isopropylmalate dehydratase small subunit
MGKTIIQKIFENHSKQSAVVGDIIDIGIDVRVARDFGGANVVKNLEENNLTLDDAEKTYFTFDCNPGGCDQKYAANQHICRIFARKNNVKTFDINSGIGTHLVIDEEIAKPGGTIVSTDSHANILGAIGAFGQGMGDKDIAHAFAYGKVWFKVPPTIKIVLKGRPSKIASPKDVALKLLQEFGANGLLGFAAEIYGDYIDMLPLDARITIASMATEMGGIIILFPFKKGIAADSNANYEEIVEVDIDDLEPLISLPGHPEDVVDINELERIKVDSGFIGSCTNGRMSDMRAAAKILDGKRIAPGRVLKIVPSTDSIWKKCLDGGLIKIFKDAGALIGSAGCAGCAAGQIGQTGTGEIAVSSGNRNFVGKQGKGDIYLASPETVAASLISGYITSIDDISSEPVALNIPETSHKISYQKKDVKISRLTKIEGKAWVIKKDNIDTDMIFHNRYLSITDINEMGQFTFDNLEGFENFAKKANPSDIIIAGKNFGAGSSRQQAVDCFKSLKIGVIIAESFGAIYERNAINSAMPILIARDITSKVDNGDELSIDFTTGKIINKTKNTEINVKPFSKSQLEIYKNGGLLQK